MIDLDKEELSSELRGSLLRFTQFFYPLLTARQFILSSPPGRESHFITISKALTQAARLEIPEQRLIINTPPGSGKSTLLVMWTAWTLAQYPDARYLYISYSKVLAAKHTESIKRILSLPHYNYLFDVRIRHDSKAREYFQTTKGGAVAAFGSGGAITGQDAGLPGLDRFSGAVIIDDAHKPDEVHSDTIRLSVIDNYRETIQQRARGINVPSIFIGQRLHEDDLAAYLLNKKDGHQWQQVIIKGIDDAGNPFYPEVYPVETLRIRQEKDPYVFASQFQQDPIPAGGALFKPEWFVILDEDPKMLATFITADTAETSKSYNDATVFSFWGVYAIESYERKTGEYGLHWIDCLETRIEPKDLKNTFMDFWAECMRYPSPPKLIAIEKKSTGGTLLSLIDEIRAVQLRDIPRTRESGNKTKRFLEAQPYVAERRVSFTKSSRHVKLCVDHMSKITANETHRWDDICFVAGTQIATKFGYKNIEDITINDLIITPFGYGKVKACGQTGMQKVINKLGLIGTSNHPILHQFKFEQLDALTDDARVHRLSFIELLKWKYQKLLLSMELNIDSWDRGAIILAKQIKINEVVLKACMSPSGNIIPVKAFPLAMSFIIKIIIILITVTTTWSVFRASNILLTTKKIVCDGIIAKKAKNILNWFKKPLKNGTEALKEEPGIAKMHEQVCYNNGIITARFVTMRLSESETPFIAPKNATISSTPESPEKKEQEKKVYNLTVEEYGVYYANDILVSNCDTAADAIKFALIDKIIVQSTIAQTDYNQLAKSLSLDHNKVNRLKKAAYTR